MAESAKTPTKHTNEKITAAVLISALATYGLMRRGHYSASFMLYQRTGGGGFNIHQTCADGHVRRRFAIDYHPFWDKQSQTEQWRLHYHRGDSHKEIRKHRPYEGGW